MTDRHLKITILAPMLLSGLAWSQAALAPGTKASSSATKMSTGTNNESTKQGVDGSYVIGPGDIIAVSVWKEPDVSKVIPVRSDGKISLPLAGELQAGGVTPRELEKTISTGLRDYISDPEVTVIVQETRSRRFNILGQVAKPGEYSLKDSTTMLDAIAMAGGFRDFAKQKSIYVLRARPDGSQQRLPFNYKEAIKGGNEAQNIMLEPHDTVVVP
jgi:polysaccharide biosynthesis/export protein